LPNSTKSWTSLGRLWNSFTKVRASLTIQAEESNIYPSTVIDSRKRRTHQPEASPAPGTVPQPQGASLFEEKSRTKAKTPVPGKSRLTLAELKALEEQRERDVILGYNRIEDLWPRMLHGDVEAEREWMIEVEKLVEMFRETRNLFLTTRVIV